MGKNQFSKYASTESKVSHCAKGRLFSTSVGQTFDDLWEVLYDPHDLGTGDTEVAW